MNVCYFGAGKLGLSLAVWDAHCGHHVVCVDINKDTVSAIQQGISPIDEPDVQELLTGAHRKRCLTATQDGLTAILSANIIFILVPTPSNPDGSFSLKHVLDTANVIGRGLCSTQTPAQPPLVVCVSTIMPGDSRKIVEAVERESGLKCGKDWHYCYSPEFVRQGSIVHDYANPDVLLIGEHCSAAGDILRKFHMGVVESPVAIYRMSLESAEIAKIGLNTAVVAKMAVANQLMWLCHSTPGANARDVLRSIGADPRIGHRYFCGGTWPGGPCFPRDQWALVAAGHMAGVKLSVASSVDALHQQQCLWLAKEVLYHLDRVGGSTIGILGITYKPGVPIVEESQGLALHKMLQAVDGSSALLWDPIVLENSLAEVVEESDVLVLMTCHPELQRLGDMDLEGRVLIDCWNFAPPTNAEHIVLGVGK